MTILSTYGEMQARIADELGDRQDLLVPLSDASPLLTQSPIQNAIQSAIALWERELFYFNEVYEQNIFTTVPGQELYQDSAGLIQTAPAITHWHVLISGNRYPLIPRPWGYLEDTSVNPLVTGQPIDVAYMAEVARFYPIPDGAYPITISGYRRANTMVQDGNATFWTQDAYDLIRTQAKLILARELLHDPDLATECELSLYGASSAGGNFARIPNARSYVYALKAETTRRRKSRIIPSYF